jgi:endonuclease YncB( thermonuclease family)
MAISNKEFIDVLKAEGLWPPQANAEAAYGAVEFPVGKLKIDGDASFTSIYVMDGDTIELHKPGYVFSTTGDHGTVPAEGMDGMATSLRYYGLDTKETAKEGTGKAAEPYANWQTRANLALFKYAERTGKNVDVTGYNQDAYKRTVAAINIDGTDVADLFVRNGISAAGTAAEAGFVPEGGITVRSLQESMNEAATKGWGLWNKNQIYDVLRDVNKETEYLDGYINDRFGKAKSMTDDTVKLGDVYLDIPPTHISINQLRTSYSTPQFGGESKPTSTSTARTTIKLNLIFNGEDSVNDDFKRIYWQFIYCPINLLYSKDIYEKVVSDNPYIARMNTATINTEESSSSKSSSYFIPVTMDSWTVYTIEGHPGSIGCTIQLSIFNYSAYFEGAGNGVEYYTYSDNPGKHGNAVRYTKHLEEAIHPYNQYIMKHLGNSIQHFDASDSRTLIFKVEDNKSRFEGKQEGINEDVSDLSEYLKVILESEVDELMVNGSVTFHNNFAWLPIIGYTQPTAQYIGPGETNMSLSIRTKNNKTISGLLATFGEMVLDRTKHTYYDDRYLVSNSLSRLCKASVCSLRNISITNVDHHPGWSDINIQLSKSSYADHQDEVNPAAEFDEYFGLQRLIKAANVDEVMEALERELKLADMTDISLPAEDDLLGQMCILSGIINAHSYISDEAYLGYNEILSNIRAFKATINDKDMKELGFSKPLMGDIKSLEVKGTDIIDRMFIQSLPISVKSDPKQMKAIVDFETYYNAKKKAGVVNEFDSFESALRGDNSKEGFELRAEMIDRYLPLDEMIDMTGTKNKIVDVNKHLFNAWEEYWGDRHTVRSLSSVYIKDLLASGVDTSVYDEEMENIVYRILRSISNEGMMLSYQKAWNPLALSMARGHAIVFKFTGTILEAQIIKAALRVGDETSSIIGEAASFGTHGSKARKFFSLQNNVKYPSISVKLTCHNKDVAYSEYSTSMSEASKEASWSLATAFRAKKSNDAISSFTGNDKINQSEVSKELALLREDMEDVAFSRIPMPHAAHRYFPFIDQYIKHSELFSASMGDWFRNTAEDDPYSFFEEVSETVENSVSPLMNNKGWTSTYLQKRYGNTYINKINEDINDPSKIMEALSLPVSSKDSSDRNKDGSLARLKDGKMDTSMPKFSKDMVTDLLGNYKYDEDIDNKPYSGTVHSGVFIAGFYDGAKDGKRAKDFRQNTYDTHSIWLDSDGAISGLYNKLNRNQLVPNGNMLVEASEARETNVASTLINGVGRSLAGPIDTSVKYAGVFKSTSLIMALNKNPKMFMIETDRIPPAQFALGPDSGLNIVQADEKILTMFVRAITSIHKGGSATDYKNIGWSDRASRHYAKVLVAEIKTKLRASGYSDSCIYYAKQSEVSAFVAQKEAISYEEGAPEEIFMRALRLRADSNLPVADFVDDHTKNIVARQSMASLMSTTCLENAFPTYKLYIIEEDTSDIRYFSLDDYYDLRTAQDLMIIKSKDNPVHILKGRIIVDPRYITVTDKVKQKVSKYNEDSEHELNEPSLQFIDTRLENYFNKGFTPLREGMRVCVKLGYHTDPRMLDTIFIGTITGLKGNMTSGVYELEAKGDGRELLSPPSPELRPNVSGKNFAEVISKILRTNPSIIHFGKTYGSFIEKFSRDHYTLLAIAKNGLLQGSSMAGGGLMGTIAVSLSMASPQRAMYKVGARVIAGIVGIGAGGLMAQLYSPVPYSLIQKSRDKFKHEALAQYSGHIFKGLWFSEEFKAANFSQAKKWIQGHTFDPAKAAREVAEISYNTLKYGNDPIDDNILAVDIWQTGMTPWKTFNMPVNGARTVWDILVDIKRMYPNFALDIRPYGNRSTLFMGPYESEMWRTDDPLQAMAPQLYQMSNGAPWADGQAYAEHTKAAIENMVTRDQFHNATPNTRNIAPREPFQRTHLVSSFSDIIMNGVRSTPYRGWNDVIVSYSKDPDDDDSPPIVNQVVNAQLDPKAKRTKYVNLDWTNDKQMANAYALGFLKEGVGKMYGGTLSIRGNSKVEPHDKVYICDSVNKMFGWIEVETVIHKLDMNTGFTTHIVPNMVCSINDDAYTTTSQLFRKKMLGSVAKLILHTAAAYPAGIALTAVLAPVLGSAAFIVGIVLGTAALGYTVYQSASAIKSKAEAIMTEATANGLIKEEQEYIQHKLQNILMVSTMKSSFDLGIFSHYVLKFTGGPGNIKRNVLAYTTNTAERAALIEKVSAGSKARFAVASNYIAKLSNKTGVTSTSKMKKILDDAAKKMGRAPINFDDYEVKMAAAVTPEERVLQRKMLAIEIEDLVKEAANDFSDDVKTKITSTINDPAALDKLTNSSVIEPEIPKAGDGKVNTRAAAAKPFKPIATKANLKIAAGGFLAFLALGAELLPLGFETIAMNAMLKSNVIFCSPLTHKSSQMMTGLEGYINQSSYLHLGSMIIHAKDFMNDAIDSVRNWDQVVQIGDSSYSKLTNVFGRSVDDQGGM